jgi:hypothetical protein
MADTDNTVYTTVVRGTSVYSGDSLTDAARAWDANTYNLGGTVPGGIEVRTYRGEYMVRNGWILHVHDDGVVYLSPHIAGAVVTA